RTRSRPFLILPTLALTTAACGGTSTTSPTSPSTTVASPTTTETWPDTLPVGGSKFYSFVVSQNGTVNVTLVSVSVTDVPSTAALGVAIATPSGTGWPGGTGTDASAGTDQHVAATCRA